MFMICHVTHDKSTMTLNLTKPSFNVKLMPMAISGV